MYKLTNENDDMDKVKNIRNSYRSIRWQIVAIFVFLVVGFVIFLSITLLHSSSQTSLLREIEDSRYPAQSKIESAFYDLQLIHIAMEESILTNEADVLLGTQKVKRHFEENIFSVAQLGGDYQIKAEALLEKFNAYYSSSYALANDFIINPSIDYELYSTRGLVVTDLYADLKFTLERFKQQEFENLTLAIEDVSSASANNRKLGLPLGILFIFSAIVLAFLVGNRIIDRTHNIVNILRQIAKDDSDMSVRINDSGRDEMAELAYWFNVFIAKLQRKTDEQTAEIKRLAYTDSLTELPNRRLFTHYLESEINRCVRENKTLAVMFLDLDNFKTINDQMGHDAGDILVRNVASRLNKAIRGSDVVAINYDNFGSENPMVARMGGDEFMLMLPNAGDINDIAAVAERIRKTVLAPMSINHKNVQIGVSIGVAIFPTDGTNADQIASHADLAMYSAKNTGKNSYRFYDKQMQKQLNKKVIVENHLKALVGDADESFSFMFQPKFDLLNNEAVGAEILFRFDIDGLGSIPAQELFAIATTSELAVNLDRWILNQTFSMMKKWQDNLLLAIPIAINLSAKFINSSDLTDTVNELMVNYQIKPALIELEITETSSLRDNETVIRNIRSLRDMGIRIAMDNFGTDHASLSLLHRCDIDVLKIDRELISNHANLRNSSMLKGLVGLAKSLETTVVAEGVETQAELEHVQELQFDCAQGYALAKPLTEIEFEAFLQKSL